MFVDIGYTKAAFIYIHTDELLTSRGQAQFMSYNIMQCSKGYSEHYRGSMSYGIVLKITIDRLSGI